MLKEELKKWIEEYLKGTDYELITLNVSAGNDILVEVDRLAGVDVDFCAELNRYLVEKLDNPSPECSTDGHWQSDRAELFTRSRESVDYSLEVGSVSLTDPFKTKMQFEKNLGHDVEVLAKEPNLKGKEQFVKYHGQLVSVDEETFSVDVEEKVKDASSKRPVKQIVTYTWRYEEPKYVKYDLKF